MSPANSQKTFKIFKNDTCTKIAFHRLHNNKIHVKICLHIAQFINSCGKLNTLYKSHLRYECVYPNGDWFLFKTKLKVLNNLPKQQSVFYFETQNSDHCIQATISYITTKYKTLETVPKQPFAYL